MSLAPSALGGSALPIPDLGSGKTTLERNEHAQTNAAAVAATAESTTKLRAHAAKWLAIEESEGETELEFAARYAAPPPAARLRADQCHHPQGLARDRTRTTPPAYGRRDQVRGRHHQTRAERRPARARPPRHAPPHARSCTRETRAMDCALHCALACIVCALHCAQPLLGAMQC